MQNSIKVLLTGSSWCRVLQKQLNEHGICTHFLKKCPGNYIKKIFWTYRFSRIVNKYNILHVMFPTGSIKTLRLAKMKKLPVVCHWIGSDVLKLNDPVLRDKFEKSCPYDALHIVVAGHLATELSERNITAFDTIPNLTNNIIQEIKPLPKQPAVLSYWPDSRFDFYNADLICKLAARFPSVPFRIVKATGKNISAPDNIEFLGERTDMQQIIENVTCYIRHVPHDGEPVLIAETLSMGRYVVYNHPKHGCEYAQTIDEIGEKLSFILNKTAPNIEGFKWVLNNMNVQKNIINLISIYRKLSESSH